MHRASLFWREVFPLLLVMTGLVVAAILLDALLHHFRLAWIGRYLGIPGVLLILVSMRYSLRKHKLVTTGNPAVLLKYHKWLAWLGSLLVLVHAGVHFHAVLPWLAVIAMLVNVASGLTGTFLLSRARAHVEARRAALVAGGASPAEIEDRLFWDATTFDLLKRWRVVHLPIGLAFATLALGHLIAIFLFWGWR